MIQFQSTGAGNPDCQEGVIYWNITSNVAEKRRETKGKREKEKYTHLNPEFQRIAQREKKAFLSDQFFKNRGKYRMGKIRDLFKKIRDTKGTFHAKTGTIKDRNGNGHNRSRRY